jgi:hypothetical protein
MFATLRSVALKIKLVTPLFNLVANKRIPHTGKKAAPTGKP